MVTLHCTKKLFRSLRFKPDDQVCRPTTRLGDWCANVLHPPRGKRFILIMNQRSLLSVLVSATAAQLPRAFANAVVGLLRRRGIAEPLIADEAAQMQTVRFAPARDRRVLGCMNDAAFQVKVDLEHQMYDLCISDIEDRLAQTWFSPNKHRQPHEVARELMESGPGIRTIGEP